MKAIIVDNKLWAENAGLLTLKSKVFTNLYRAGQLCMLSTYPLGTDPLLKRPFAPYSCNKTTGIFTIMYAIVGKGTNLLSTYRAGMELDIEKPHGNGFKIRPNVKRAALVTGGVGLAPIMYLAGELHEKGCKVDIYYGARTDTLVYPEIKNEKRFNINIYTEDGTCGTKGFPTTGFKKDIDNDLFDLCYTCGPLPLMKAAFDICKTKNLPVQVSMEQRMGCGVGACAGCMIDTIEDNGKHELKRCCTEGPVFDGYTIAWK